MLPHVPAYRRAALPAGGPWQLAAGHFVPAKMTPVIVGPSPDTEAGTDAAGSRYRRCPSGIPYRIPIAVLGGAYPFHYEILTGPSGMTIGANVGDSDYGILSWSNPTTSGSPHAISVRVTDQDGSTAERDWNLAVIDRENTTYFVFVDATDGSNSNSGAYSAPKQNFLGWYGANISDSTHAGKQVFYFAGTYATDIISDPSGVKFWLNPSYKPAVHVAIPGESVTFDCDTYYFGGMRQDFCVSGVNHINGVATESALTRMTYYRNDNGPGRNLFFENTFGSATGTPSGGSNSGAIMFDGDESYCVVSHNTFTHDSDTFVLVYQTKNSVFQHNDCRPPGTNGNGLFLKSSGYDNWSVRANYGYGAEHFMVFQDGTQSEPNHDIYNIEICWNSYRCTGGSPIEFSESSGASGGPIWIYRNSFSGTADIPHNMFNAALSSPVGVYEKNILQGVALLADAGSNPDVFDFSNDSTTQTDVTGWLNASTNLLEGSGLAYLGTHGAEIA